ncbi:MAG: ribonuclease H-like domain-containing protein [Myxococcales bacterium]
MIRRTFQLIPGIGPGREKALWSKGVVDWAQLQPDAKGHGLSKPALLLARELLDQASNALQGRDLSALASLLPSREHWRLYPEFQDEIVYFDIETDGRAFQAPTVVTLFDGARFEVFVQGRNLDALPDALAKKRIWCTFNGSCFDVPVLRQYFGAFPTPAAHLDLRFLCKRLGWHGGLKALEDQLGFSRPRHLLGVDGMDAVLLWRAYQASADLEALRFLVEYNLYDAIQLRTLMERAFNQAVEDAGWSEHRLPVFDRGDVLYDVSRHLLELGPTPDDRKLLERIRRYDRNLLDE